MKVVSSVLEEIISEMPELVIPERKGIVDYINIIHDYYEIWGRILKRLGREFVNILKIKSLFYIHFRLHVDAILTFFYIMLTIYTKIIN